MFKRLFVILLTAISLCMAVVSTPMFAYDPFPTEGLGSWHYRQWRDGEDPAPYSYAPATVYYNGTFHQFYCSNSEASDSHFNPYHLPNFNNSWSYFNKFFNSWDYIRYRTSKDGVHWSAPRIVMSVNVNGDEVSACDPSVVKGKDGYWYMLYDGNIPGDEVSGSPRYGTVVYLARSKYIQGPYFKYTVAGWEDEIGDVTTNPPKPEIMLIGESTDDGYGVGQQSLAVDNHGYFHVWFRNAAREIKHIRVKNLTSLKYGDAKSVSWKKNNNDAKHDFSETFIDENGNGVSYDIGDVRYNGLLERWEMWCVTGYMVENTKITKFISRNGVDWIPQNENEIGAYNFIHNIGVSGDERGWTWGDKYLISFSGPKPGLSKTKAELKTEGYDIDAQSPERPLIGEWPMWQVLVGGVWKQHQEYYSPSGFLFPHGVTSTDVVYFTGDYDGDGVTDLGAVDRSTNKWYVYSSGYRNYIYDGEELIPGMNHDYEVIAGDYDGDGKTDIGAVDKANGRWIIKSSKTDLLGLGSSQLEPNWIPPGWQWGGMNSFFNIVVGDFDGDGKADRAIYAPEGFDNPVGNGRKWYIISSMVNDYAVANGLENVYGKRIPFGWIWSSMTNSHVAVSGDFDGDGITDRVIYNKNDGTWSSYSSRCEGEPVTWHWDWRNDNGSWHNSTGLDNYKPFNITPEDLPFTLPFTGDFDGDGVSDLVQVDFKNRRWYFYGSLSEGSAFPMGADWGKFQNAGDPVVLIGDFDGDGKTDRAFADKENHRFYVISSKTGREGINQSVKYIQKNPDNLYYFAKSAAEKPIEEPKAAPVVSKAPSMNVAVDGKKVTVTNVEYGSKVAVFDMLGKSVLEAPAGMNAATFEVPTYGKYIVRAGAQSRVIMVK